MNELPQKLYDLRKSRGLRQEELAEKLNVSRQAISKWEMGTGVPTIDNLVGISEFFGVTLDSLVKDEYEASASSAIEEPPAPMYAEAEAVSPTEPSAAKKIIVNILTVIAARVVMLCISEFIMFILRFAEYNLDLHPYIINLLAVIEYPLYWLVSLPYFFILYLIFGRNKSLFSKPLFDKKEPLSERLGIKKVLLVFLLHVLIDIATQLALNRLFDATWASCITVFEHFLMYVIFTYGKANISRNKKVLIAALICVLSYCIAAIMSIWQLHVILNEFEFQVITYRLTYNELFYLINYAIVFMNYVMLCAFVVFHGIWTEKELK